MALPFLPPALGLLQAVNTAHRGSTPREAPMFRKEQIPNWISAFRILASVPLLYPLARSGLWGWFMIAGAGLAGTDLLDGYLAKRNNWHSALGKVLDPVGDKVCAWTITCLVLNEHGMMGALFWPLFALGVYDSGMLFMRWFAIESANEVARWKTTVLFFSLLAMGYTLYDGAYREPLMCGGELLFHTSAILAIISGAIYIVRNVRIPALG